MLCITTVPLLKSLRTYKLHNQQMMLDSRCPPARQAVLTKIDALEGEDQPQATKEDLEPSCRRSSSQNLRILHYANTPHNVTIAILEIHRIVVSFCFYSTSSFPKHYEVSSTFPSAF